jgi:hypothetical protein
MLQKIERYFWLAVLVSAVFYVVEAAPWLGAVVIGVFAWYMLCGQATEKAAPATPPPLPRSFVSPAPPEAPSSSPPSPSPDPAAVARERAARRAHKIRMLVEYERGVSV